MKQRYNWQVLFIIKFLQSEFSEPVFRQWLSESLADIVRGANLQDVVINIAIETDLLVGDLLESVPDFLKEMGNRYFLVLRPYSKNIVFEISEFPDIMFKGTDVPLRVINAQQYGKINEPEPLAFVLAQMQESIECDQSIVITWDHGSAYGIFYEPDKKRNIKAIFSNYRENDIKEGESKFFNLTPSAPLLNVFKQDILNKAIYISDNFIAKDPNIFAQVEVDKSKFLTMDELAMALKVLPNSKADILLMVNCSMMTIDTQYALRDCVRYLIAPESFIHFQTFNFGEILKYLTNQPTITSEVLGEHIISSLPSSPIFKQYPENLEKIAISMVNLGKLFENNTWESFKEMVAKLDDEAANVAFLKSVQVMRRQFFILPLTWEVNQTNLLVVDAFSILEQILQIKDISKLLKEAINNFISAYKLGSEILKSNRTYFGKYTLAEEFSCKGFSFFFPTFKGEFKNNNYILQFYNETIGNVNVSAVARDTYWNNFLFKYYNAVD